VTDPDTDGLAVLEDLALNLRSSWNHRADDLWEQIDPDMWRETGSPWLVVQSAPRTRLREFWAKAEFRASAEALREVRRRTLSGPSWFSSRHAGGRLGTVAFFSMEYALSEALPIYSGGLGNVAGDYLKAASDLGVPLVGVGLLYQQGYFRQHIDATGAQREFLPYNDVTQLPVIPVRDNDGGRVRVQLPRPGPPVWLRAWEARVGRVPLYLLDSNDPANGPADRGITSQLYGGGAEVRLLQEMALGIGGWRLLRALGIAPDVCHLNEGHATLAALERAREFMGAGRHAFDVALAATRVGNVFTTHTPVEAGFDRFPRDLLEAYLGAYVREELGIAFDDFLALGRPSSSGAAEPLTTAWLAARLSGAINAVSRRHGEVSRGIFQVLYPRWPAAQVPIGHVTNGVHVPSWDSAEADTLWTAACGSDRWDGTMEGVGEKLAACADGQLWAFRASARAKLIPFVRERLNRQLAAAGMTGNALAIAARVLDPDALTIGMARRFTDYKRPTLLLRNPERLARLLRDPRRPVQIVVAGKAHPRDDRGKSLVQEWVRFVRREDVRTTAVFLADYDLRLAEHLVQGVDLWINTPRPPWEACGTSGMKVLVNGGVNLSARDGWWAEAGRNEDVGRTPEGTGRNEDVGWVLEGDGSDDESDASRLYELLERDVVPAFYNRDPAGIPRAWVARMRASMARLTPTYSANRALREYTERYYLPAADAFVRRSSANARAATEIAEWQRTMQQHWPWVRFGGVRVKTEGGRHRFEATVYVDDIDPQWVSVELYADGEGSSGPMVAPMSRGPALVGARGFVYFADMPDTRPADHFTPRAVATYPDLAVPLESQKILWAR
jgi:starch phosphorylase